LKAETLSNIDADYFFPTSDDEFQSQLVKMARIKVPRSVLERSTSNSSIGIANTLLNNVQQFFSTNGYEFANLTEQSLNNHRRMGCCVITVNSITKL